MEKRLYRDESNKMIFGVCAGFAEYFNVDVTLIRIIWLILLFTGVGFLAYIIAAIVMPEKSSSSNSSSNYSNSSNSSYSNTETNDNSVLIIGAAVILLGIILLFKRAIPEVWMFAKGYFWPIAIVAVGILIILSAFRRK